MIVLIYILIAIFHIPVTQQRALLVNPCLDNYDPTCQDNQEIFLRDKKVPYSAHIDNRRSSIRDAYAAISKVPLTKTSKLLNRKPKKLGAYIDIPKPNQEPYIISKAVLTKTSKLLSGKPKKLWAYIDNPISSNQDAYKMSKEISTKTLKLLNGKPKKLFLPTAFVPAIIAGTNLLTALMEIGGKNKR